MAKASAITEIAWKGPVYIVPLGWGLSATFVVLFVLCFLAALLFPNAELLTPSELSKTVAWTARFVSLSFSTAAAQPSNCERAIRTRPQGMYSQNEWASSCITQ